MSSYLNFYLVPESKESQDVKPLLLKSYSRNSNVYQAFYENANPAFIGNGDEPNYTELTSDLMCHVVNEVKDDLENTQKNFTTRMEAYRSIKLEEDTFNKYVEDFQSTTEYIEELKNTVRAIEMIASMIKDLEYSDFEKILINID